MQKKRITVSVPVYNEEKNIRPAYERIKNVMQGLPSYDYEIVFFDDGSTDASREEIEALCAEDRHVKAVFYTCNFGYSKTVFYCMQQATGDAAVLVHCDLQNPPEVIPQMVQRWEDGADVVLGVKTKSRENRFVFLLRTLCYWIANVLFGMNLVPHATEFELLDGSVVKALRQVRGNEPFLRGLVLEYGRRIEKVYYTQDKRFRGKSHFRLSGYYDFAICSLTQTSRCVPRRLMVFSIIGFLLLALESILRFIPSIAHLNGVILWDGILLRFGVFLLLVLLMGLALMFEYVIALMKNSVQKPVVTEEKRIGF